MKSLEDEDRDPLLRLMADGRIKKTYMVPDLTGRKEEDAFFRRMRDLSSSDERFVFGIYLDGRLIGFLNDCGSDGTEIELGCFISPEHWNRGYASEALRAAIDELFRMGYEHVTAGCFEENKASRRVMEKCGMRPLPGETNISYRGSVHRCLYCAIGRDTL